MLFCKTRRINGALPATKLGASSVEIHDERPNTKSVSKETITTERGLHDLTLYREAPLQLLCLHYSLLSLHIDRLRKVRNLEIPESLMTYLTARDVWDIRPFYLPRHITIVSLSQLRANSLHSRLKNLRYIKLNYFLGRKINLGSRLLEILAVPNAELLLYASQPGIRLTDHSTSKSFFTRTSEYFSIRSSPGILMILRDYFRGRRYSEPLLLRVSPNSGLKERNRAIALGSRRQECSQEMRLTRAVLGKPMSLFSKKS